MPWATTVSVVVAVVAVVGGDTKATVSGATTVYPMLAVPVWPSLLVAVTV